MTAARAVNWRLISLLLGAAAIVWLVDYLVKEWVIASLPERQAVPVLGEILQFTFVRNSGAAFSIASGMTWIFTIIASVVTVVIIAQSRKLHSLPWALVLGGLLGGVLGNLTDRFIRPPGVFVGHVIDYIQVWGFPAIFNIADIFVCVSMAGFMLLVLRGEGIDGIRRNDEPDAATSAGDDEAVDTDESPAPTSDAQSNDKDER